MDHSAPRRAAAFLRDRLADPLSVHDAADHVGYSPAHLSRAFTRELGIGPGQYLAAVRFHAAKRLLLEDDAPVVDVCAAVGYTSLTTFTRRFTAAVGVAPGGFRQLAGQLADGEQTPFALPSGARETVRVRWELPGAALRRPPLVWLGWYPGPVPIGLPRAGRLVTGTDRADLPLCEGSPWLLAFAVAPEAGLLSHLAPTEPLVAVHPRPVPRGARPPADVTLRFAAQTGIGAPLLSALPVLRPGALGAPRTP